MVKNIRIYEITQGNNLKGGDEWTMNRSLTRSNVEAGGRQQVPHKEKEKEERERKQDPQRSSVGQEHVEMLHEQKEECFIL